MAGPRVRPTSTDIQKARARLRMILHFKQVSRNVSRTCRFFGISRTQFYYWLRRYDAEGRAGLLDRKPGPARSPWRTPDHIEALVVQVRRERRYGALRLRYFLERYHRVYLSVPTIQRILKEHRINRFTSPRTRPGPKRRRIIREPGRSVQVDVKHVRLRGRRLYQFTAIDEATRYRVLQIYDHSNVRSAIEFIELVRQKLPVALERVQTDHGSEFGSDFTWHLHDLGIQHTKIPPGCPEANGKVERSHRTDEDEFYRRYRFRTPEQLRAALRRWETEYDTRRPHLALKGRTPAEFLAELKIRPNSVRQSA